MERRAQIVLVLSFLLLSGTGLVFFLRWISPEDNTLHEERLVQFDGSVSGLSVGSGVRYLGVPSGQVLSIGLSPERNGRVDVLIGVDQPLPPSEALIALLEAQGITGLSIIELRDRSESRAGFAVRAGAIPGYPSVFSQVSNSAVSVARDAEATLGQLSELLTEQVVEDLSVSIAQLRILTDNLAGASSEVDQLLASVARVSSEMETTLPAYRALALRLDREVIPTVVEAGQSLRASSEALAQTIGNNRQEVERLLQQDLPTLVGLTDDLSTTLQELYRLMHNINSQPGALLYGEQVSEVEIPNE